LLSLLDVSVVDPDRFAVDDSVDDPLPVVLDDPLPVVLELEQALIAAAPANMMAARVSGLPAARFTLWGTSVGTTPPQKGQEAEPTLTWRVHDGQGERREAMKVLLGQRVKGRSIFPRPLRESTNYPLSAPPSVDPIGPLELCVEAPFEKLP
jgi:hypothetical protein